jgi:hypothetical protein
MQARRERARAEIRAAQENIPAEARTQVNNVSQFIIVGAVAGGMILATVGIRYCGYRFGWWR